MNKNLLIVIIGAVIILTLVIYFSFNGDSEEDISNENLNQEVNQVTQEKSNPVKYFKKGSSKIVIEVDDHILYTDSPTTEIRYYALENSEKVHFKESDNAYVRILGITRFHQDNVEIFHPNSEGEIDDTIYSGDITINEPGKYLVKVCLGSSINLDSVGTMIWPFGCHEDSTSVVIDVFEK